MRAGVVLACALVVSACTAESDGVGPGTPASADVRISVAEVECADDIRNTVLGGLQCDLVTLPARNGSADTVSVHVTRLTPPAGASDRAPILVVPAVATIPNYLGLAPMAQRTGRQVVIVDARGTAHSSPALGCPEVSETTSQELGGRIRGTQFRHAYLAAVEACSERLREEGVNPAAFTAVAVAADLADVREALGIQRWAVIAFGSAGRFVPELMRIDGEAVEAVVLDSVELPDQPPVAAAAALTPKVVHDLLASCASDIDCRTRFPRPDRLWRDARQRAAERPVVLDAGDLGTVRLDEATLARVIRSIVSDGGSSGLSFTPAAVPAVLDEVVDGGGRLLREEIAPLLTAQDPFCLGYLPDCLLKMKPSAGAYYSMFCSAAGLVGPPRPAGRDVVIDTTFARRLNDDVCERWGVQPSDPAPPALDWSAPTLVLAGRFAPYAPLSELRRLAAALPAGSLVVDPAGADNVLPRTACMLELRRTWIDDPVADVPTPTCLAGERIDWYLGADVGER